MVWSSVVLNIYIHEVIITIFLYRISFQIKNKNTINHPLSVIIMLVLNTVQRLQLKVRLPVEAVRPTSIEKRSPSNKWFWPLTIFYKLPWRTHLYDEDLENCFFDLFGSTSWSWRARRDGRLPVPTELKNRESSDRLSSARSGLYQSGPASSYRIKKGEGSVQSDSIIFF